MLNSLSLFFSIEFFEKKTDAKQKKNVQDEIKYLLLKKKERIVFFFWKCSKH